VGGDTVGEEASVVQRNGWLIALWVIGGVLLAAGGFLLTQTVVGSGRDVVPVMVLPVVFGALAPWLVGVGLAAIVGAVFVKASQR